ncbi:MAG TPA: patatin-like phospholipase family protein [Bryobacteraceae bacterium]|nr:patatin-like phospholipase family protein [Bryobacteraceae bacterium]
MNALVLSAGGMYGAYQAGAWKALADVFHPELVVGASIGALNGWAIAGGCDPDELIERWLNLGEARRYRWKFPAGFFGGVLNSDPLQRAIRDIYESYTPRIDFATVLTDLVRLRPRIVHGKEVTWRHLLATTAIVGIFDQVRIDGRLYSDGGLLAAVPLWAAAELGATKALVIDVLPETPGLIAKTFVGGMRALSPFQAPATPSVEVVTVKPARLLGQPLESIYWKRENAERWIRQGEQEAHSLKHSIVNCFEAK